MTQAAVRTLQRAQDGAVQPVRYGAGAIRPASLSAGPDAALGSLGLACRPDSSGRSRRPRLTAAPSRHSRPTRPSEAVPAPAGSSDPVCSHLGLRSTWAQLVRGGPSAGPRLPPRIGAGLTHFRRVDPGGRMRAQISKQVAIDHQRGTDQRLAVPGLVPRSADQRWQHTCSRSKARPPARRDRPARHRW